MAAQILPLVDEGQAQARQQQLAMMAQNAQQQDQYQQQLMGLHQAEFVSANQREQQLQPLRQQMMQAELDKTAQSIQQSHDAWQHAQNMMPYEEAQAQADSLRAQYAATGAQREFAGVDGEDPLQLQEFIQKRLEANQRMKLGASADVREGKVASAALGAHLATVAQLDDPYKAAALSALGDSVDDTTKQAILNAPPLQKNYLNEIAQKLDPESANAFELAVKGINTPPTTEELRNKEDYHTPTHNELNAQTIAATYELMRRNDEGKKKLAISAAQPMPRTKGKIDTSKLSGGVTYLGVDPKTGKQALMKWDGKLFQPVGD